MKVFQRLQRKVTFWLKLVYIRANIILVEFLVNKPWTPNFIRNFGRMLIPFLSFGVGFYLSLVSQQVYFHTILYLIIFTSTFPLILSLADSLERKTPTLKRLSSLSAYLRAIVNFYPCYSDDLTINSWKKDIQEFTLAIEQLVALVISDLNDKNVNEIAKSYHLACNLMIYTTTEEASEDSVKKALSKVDGTLLQQFDLYEGIDESRTDVIAYMMLAGLSEKSVDRNYKPCFIKVFGDLRATYPGAPMLIHNELTDKKEWHKSTEDYFKNTKSVKIDSILDFDEFGTVSEETQERFFEIFGKRKRHVKSFISYPLHWDNALIGCLNIESYRKNFLDDTALRALEYVLNVVRPIGEVFAYEFSSRFIEKTIKKDADAENEN